MRRLGLMLAGFAASAAAAPEGWTRMELSEGFSTGKGYSIAVPPGVERTPTEGIDSDVAALNGAGLHMLFDYGWYGPPASCGRRPDCVEGDERIDGWPAHIARERRPVAWEPQATGSYSAFITLDGPMSLAIIAYCETEEACDRAERMVRSIEFKR